MENEKIGSSGYVFATYVSAGHSPWTEQRPYAALFRRHGCVVVFFRSVNANSANRDPRKAAVTQKTIARSAC